MDEQSRNNPMTAVPFNLYGLPVVELAQALIGTRFLVDGVGGCVVETEAYRADEAAAHSFRGPTPRNAAMFGPPGRLYVYRSYGLHWCVNIVGGDQPGSAVLLRAIEPEVGLAAMVRRRALTDVHRLCSGPGKLAAALAITGALDGAVLNAGSVQLLARTEPAAIVTGPRIGITKAADLPWRFGLAGSRFVSRAFPR
jgi:DNA-3-methyladenine glycosylase